MAAAASKAALVSMLRPESDCLGVSNWVKRQFPDTGDNSVIRIATLVAQTINKRYSFDCHRNC